MTYWMYFKKHSKSERKILEEVNNDQLKSVADDTLVKAFEAVALYMVY